MDYLKNIRLKDGRECLIRNATALDAQEVLNCFNLTHSQTDFLTSYPDESTHTLEGEKEFLDKVHKSEKDVELMAILDSKTVGLAGINSVGSKFKIKHRATFGISIDKEYWRLGIGRELTLACIDCAKKAGYKLLELEVVADNSNAMALYKSVGFVEFGRYPKGFFSRISTWQEIVYMYLEL